MKRKNTKFVSIRKISSLVKVRVANDNDLDAKPKNIVPAIVTKMMKKRANSAALFNKLNLQLLKTHKGM